MTKQNVQCPDPLDRKSPHIIPIDTDAARGFFLRGLSDAGRAGEDPPAFIRPPSETHYATGKISNPGKWGGCAFETGLFQALGNPAEWKCAASVALVFFVLL